ncbi:MAG: hypothetical protein JST89_04275 [Cyanobacteria bacterium SZAS-4]|nr:hypothetical protein [Cyanobacteria bacterium SZAS-4]
MTKTNRSISAALLLPVLSTIWLYSASPSQARRHTITWPNGGLVFTYPGYEYDASVKSFQCGATNSALSWFAVNSPNPNDDGEPNKFFGYPDGIISGHNVIPGLTGLFQNRAFVGLPRIPRTNWMLSTFLPQGSSNAAAGYQVSITRIDGLRGRSSDFRNVVIHFRPGNVSLQNIIVTAIPQNKAQPAKSLRFSQMAIGSGERTGWRTASASYSDFGLQNNTFVNVFSVYQTGNAQSDSRVEFGRFDVRHTYAENLDNCTIFFEPSNCAQL